MTGAGTILTVSQLNEYVRMLLDGNPQLNHVFVRGEISNFKNHYSTGHLYFSLKDQDGLVRAVMFRGNAVKLSFMPQDGMRVILHGRASLFPRDGQFQLYVDEMQPDGIGALYLAFEQLKKKLGEEGLFDESRKRPLPPYPERIGIITSPTGAAVQDMLRILGHRFPLASVILYPTLVQGPGAAAQICRGIEWFAEHDAADVLIVGRGGGSLEDLWAFNDERLARTVAASPIPVISAVGHETDFTICDFAADLRAATPSNAAELAVPDCSEVFRSILSIGSTLSLKTEKILQTKRAELQALATRPVLTHAEHILDSKKIWLDRLQDRLTFVTTQNLSDHKNRFSTVCARLDALSPLAVLGRGYAVALGEDGKTVTDAGLLTPGDTLRIRFAKGTADAVVRSTIIEKAKESTENV